MNTNPFCFESLELLQERQRRASVRARAIAAVVILVLANLALLPFSVRAFLEAFRP